MKMIKCVAIMFMALAIGGSVLAKKKNGKPMLEGPEFDKRMAASYGVISNFEPDMTELEVAILGKLAPMVRERPDQAITMLEDMLTGDRPISAAFDMALANLHFENGELLRAEVGYRAAIGKHPDFRRAWNGLGMVLLRFDKHAESLESLAKSVDLGASDALTYGMIGYCHLQLGHLKSAEMAYNLAILKDPDNTEYTEGLVEIFMENERYSEALRALDQLIVKHPNRVEYWLLQTNVYLAMDKPLKSARCLEIAKKIGPLESGALYLLGNIYLKHGMLGKAKDLFVTALDSREPIKAVDGLKAAAFLASSDEFEYAAEILTLVDLESGRWSSRQRGQYHSVEAEIARARGDFDTAMDAYSKALEFDPLNGRTLLKLAELYTESGKTDKAFYLIERAQNDPQSEYDALLMQARLLIEGRQLSRSMAAIQRAMKIQPSEELEDLFSQVKRATSESLEN